MKRFFLIISLWAAVFNPVESSDIWATIRNEAEYNAAFVAPLSSHEGKLYLLLGRESAGKDAGTYDSFGGSRTSSDKKDHLLTAAREFYEEAILKETLKMAQDKVRDYIALSAGHTHYIFIIDHAHKSIRNVLYLTHFTHKLLTTIQDTFAAAYKNAPRGHAFHEKDALAYTSFDEVLEAIASSTSDSGIKVSASVTDLQGKRSQQMITLRPVLVKVLRGFAQELPYKPGEDSRIRYYTN
jgi:8-oxo-dGTP pyrophosphatase MutT (NUDIX family)